MKRKAYITGWGTQMRIPHSLFPPIYVRVIARNRKILETFYHSLHPDDVRPFDLKKCAKCRISAI